MTSELRKIIRPKPLLISIEIVLLCLFNILTLGFYFLNWFSLISLSHKATYLFWILWLIINHLALTVIIDSLAHYLTSGYEITKEGLMIIKTGWGKNPKAETIHFENMAGVDQISRHRVELKVKHSGQPKVCRILQNGDLLCQEVKTHFQVYNLSQLDQVERDGSGNIVSLTNTPRFVVADEDFVPLPEKTEE